MGMEDSAYWESCDLKRLEHGFIESIPNKAVFSETILLLLFGVELMKRTAPDLDNYLREMIAKEDNNDRMYKSCSNQDVDCPEVVGGEINLQDTILKLQAVIWHLIQSLILMALITLRYAYRNRKQPLSPHLKALKSFIPKKTGGLCLLMSS